MHGLFRAARGRLRTIEILIVTMSLVVTLGLSGVALDKPVPDPDIPVQEFSPPTYQNAPRLEDLYASSPAPNIELPSEASQRLTPEQVQQLMLQAGFPVEEIGTGVAIATAESGRIPNNTNSTGNTAGTDLGLFQINSFYWSRELALIDWTDPAANSRLAYKIWQREGWSAWTTYRSWMDDLPAPDPEHLEVPVAARVTCPQTYFPRSQGNVAQAANLVAGALGFTGTIGGFGHPGTTSDHAKGLALDFMTYDDVPTGWRIANFLLKNRKALHVKYVIFQQQIYDTRNDLGWVKMEDRGGPTVNHLDHVHVSFYMAPADLLCDPEWGASRPVWH